MKTPREVELKRFKSVGELILVQHDGALWWTDKYCLGRVYAHDGIRDLLSWWNLAVEPGQFYVSPDRVRRVGDVPRKIILTPFLPSDVPGSVLRRAAFFGHAATVRLETGVPIAAWLPAADPSKPIWLNDKYTAYLRQRHPKAQLWGTEPLKPVHYVEDGRVVAAQMPVRNA